MRAGNLRHVITIQHITSTTADGYGGTVPVWGTFAANVRAKISPLKGRELIAAQAALSEITTRFTMRYLSGVTQAMRILYGGKYYNIKEVIDFDEVHRELQIMAATGLNEG